MISIQIQLMFLCQIEHTVDCFEQSRARHKFLVGSCMNNWAISLMQLNTNKGLWNVVIYLNIHTLLKLARNGPGTLRRAVISRVNIT
jgi:hypothetical protein